MDKITPRSNQINFHQWIMFRKKKKKQPSTRFGFLNWKYSESWGRQNDWYDLRGYDGWEIDVWEDKNSSHLYFFMSFRVFLHTCMEVPFCSSSTSFATSFMTVHRRNGRRVAKRIRKLRRMKKWLEMPEPRNLVKGNNPSSKYDHLTFTLPSTTFKSWV